ncbi:MAG: GNAT family N-acetyltransferase [Anaerolineales bacterium]|jgi:RimJ/RimL family protein N-acetyltransferase
MEKHESPFPQILLRAVQPENLDIFFENQRDPDASWMAAFTSKDPDDRAAFDAHWKKIMADETVLIRTILYEGQVADSVLKYEMDGEAEVSYWIGKAFWGKGIATAALKSFLTELPTRPVNARRRTTPVPSGCWKNADL